MNKKPSFFRQLGVLVERYFNILINSKQALITMISVPLATILIVCFVSCSDMFAIKPDEDHSINEGYPVLNWETVVQEKKEDGKDENSLIEPDEATVSKWNGSDIEAPVSPTKIDGENYFLITNAAQLAFLSEASETEAYRDYLTYNYILQADINLNSHKFKSIGSKDYPFTGTFDGNGHIVRNLKIDSSRDNVGLFGVVKSTEGKSTSVEISGNDFTFYHNGIVKNVQVRKADVRTSGKNAGIIVGLAEGKARITSVSAKGGVISADGGNVGGIVGYASGSGVEVYTCYSTAKVVTKAANAGGLVGNLSASRLSGAYAAGKIVCNGSSSASKKTGCIVGFCDDSEDQLKNLYYDNEINEDEDFKAVGQKDYKGYAQGVTKEKLCGYASFLVPFKGIKTAYDIKHPSEEDKEKFEDEDYDAEIDEDIDPSYGFKKDAQLAIFGGTQTGLFMLVCVAIFVGICNSIQEICKERNILKREYMTNLSLGSYIASKLIVQAVICMIQMLVVLVVFRMFMGDKQLPESGVIFGSFWFEYYVTLFLLAFAADTTSLVVSSVVKNISAANMFIPIILIVQIVFSGVLFDMSGIMEFAANFMISKWGIAALAATSGLNDSQSSFLIKNPGFQLKLGSSMSTVKDAYAATPSNLLMVWGILLAFIVVCSILSRVLITRVKNDKR